MALLDPIYAAQVPGWPFVFVVGSYDDRITFFSQQVRGLNLAHALVASSHLGDRRRFAVVGAGAAGLSVASGLSLLLPEATVDIFEREQMALHLQKGSHQRTLHPHIYDWPHAGALEKQAGLPLLDWTADTANAVATRVYRDFSVLRMFREERLNLETLREVTAVDRVAKDAYRVSWRSFGRPNPDSANYDAVFLTIGFGAERGLEGAPLHSYWSDRGVPQAPKYAAGTTTVLVSGGGDGGLIDVCAAVLEGYDHTGLIELVTTWTGIDRFAEALESIDAAAEQAGPGFDFMAAYDQSVGAELERDGLVDAIGRRLRRRVEITFNTERARPLEQPTATLNRLLHYLLVRAAAKAGASIRHLPGRIRAAGLPQGHYEVEGAGRFEADEIFIRHGAAKSEAFANFAEIHAAYHEDHAHWLAADPARRQPPQLADEARTAFERALMEAEIPVSRRALAQAQALQPRRLRLAVDAVTGEVLLGGDVEPADLLAWWATPERGLRLELAAEPASLGGLGCAVARFLIHAHDVRLETSEPQWSAWLSQLTTLSPHVHALQNPKAQQVSAAACGMESVDATALAADLQAAMDRWTLEAIDRHLDGYLASGSEPAHWVTWRIERDLRTAMAQRWSAWRARLRADPALLARLFRLTACAVEDEVGEPSDRQVLVGPCRLPSMVRALVFALAAAVAWPVADPRGAAPGNFERRTAPGEPAATIHATGAELIDGEQITLRATQHRWSAEIALLSELSAPAEFEDAAHSSFRDLNDGVPRLDAPPLGCNLIVAADRALMAALQEGAEAVGEHLNRTQARLQAQWRSQIDDTEAQA